MVQVQLQIFFFFLFGKERREGERKGGLREKGKKGER
jgi:hypothetical protein